MTESLKIPLNSLVKYYLEGWRYGYLEGYSDYTCTIRPIVPKGSPKPRLVRVPTMDVEAGR